jgi:hypothetical protein
MIIQQIINSDLLVDGESSVTASSIVTSVRRGNSKVVFCERYSLFERLIVSSESKDRGQSTTALTMSGKLTPPATLER